MSDVLLRRARVWWEKRHLPRLERVHFRFGFRGCEILVASFWRSGDVFWAAVAVPCDREDLIHRFRTEWHFLGAAHEFDELDAETCEMRTVFLVICNRIMDRMPGEPAQLQGSQYRSHWYLAEETKRVILGRAHATEPRTGLG